VRAERLAFETSEPFDLHLTYGTIGRGPSARITGDAWWCAMNSPAGPVTMRVRAERAGGCVEFTAWGAGREWAADRARGISGVDTELRAFEPAHPLLARLQYELRGLRVVSLGDALDLGVSTIIEQRVTTGEARRSWRALVRRHGAEAPGGVPLVVPPSAREWATLPDREWRRVDVEWKRSSAVRAFAREAGRVERAADAGAANLDRRLRSIRGIGPWTAATLTHYVSGDLDAVPVGDWHFPGHVGFALAGERDADDARMLELLEPFRPFRMLALRYILAGTAGPPRRAPRGHVHGLMYAEAARR
jgi:3-methyladenine DNA glycosylase/8-oxoguanine DNA glycosylase